MINPGYIGIIRLTLEVARKQYYTSYSGIISSFHLVGFKTITYELDWVVLWIGLVGKKFSKIQPIRTITIFCFGFKLEFKKKLLYSKKTDKSHYCDTCRQKKRHVRVNKGYPTGICENIEAKLIATSGFYWGKDNMRNFNKVQFQ